MLELPLLRQLPCLVRGQDLDTALMGSQADNALMGKPDAGDAMDWEYDPELGEMMTKRRATMSTSGSGRGIRSVDYK